MRNPAIPSAGFRIFRCELDCCRLHWTILLQVFEERWDANSSATFVLAAKQLQAKALLETNEIIVRGELRLKIPLASLKSVSARDGELHLKWPEGSAVFELGEHAEKWAYKILHPKSTAEKLGIKPGLIISAMALSDDNFLDDLRAVAKNFSDSKPLKDSDLIFVGAETVSRPCADREVSRFARQRGRALDRLSQGQAGDQRAARARCRQEGRTGGCEGGELFRNSHRTEVCAAESEARLIKSGVASLAPIYRLRKNSAYCLARVARPFRSTFNALFLYSERGSACEDYPSGHHLKPLLPEPALQQR